MRFGRAARMTALIAFAALIGWLASASRATVDLDQPTSRLGADVGGSASFDAARAVDGVRYRFERGAAGFSVRSGTYDAGVSADGLSISPTSSPSRLRIETEAMTLGGVEQRIVREEWSGAANVAERGLTSDVREVVTAHADGVDWDFRILREPTQAGDLVLAADVVGADGPAKAHRDLLEWSVGGGSFSMGQIRVKDRRGDVVFTTLPTITAEGVSLEIPGDVLRTAEYPLTVDPTVKPAVPASQSVTGVAEGPQTAPQVAFDGQNFLVVWYSERTSPGVIWGARVTPAGELLDPRGFQMGDDAVFGSEAPVDVVYGSGRYLVVYEKSDSDVTTIGGRFVSVDGDVLGDASLELSGLASEDQSLPAVAFDGTGFLVAMQEEVGGLSADVYVSRLDADGELQSSFPLAAAEDAEERPAISFDGTNYLVVWEAEAASFGPVRVRGARVSTQGTVLDPLGKTLTPQDQRYVRPDLTFDGTNYLLAYESGDIETPGPITAVRVSKSGALVGAAFPVGASGARWPAAAFDGANFRVSWSDGQLKTARVKSNGQVLDAPAVTVSNDASAVESAIAVGGSQALVVWSGAPSVSISGRRLVANGTTVGSRFQISRGPNPQGDSAIAFDGTNYLVAWEDLRRGTSDIYVGRVTPQGQRLDGAGIPVPSGRGTSMRYPQLAFNGQRYLLTWLDGSAAQAGVTGALIDPSGAIVADGIKIRRSVNLQSTPKLASNGSEFLVAWTESRGGPNRVYARRVSAAGVPVGATTGFRVNAATGVLPAVGFDGSNYVVAWSGAFTGVFAATIFGARVRPDGVVLDPTPFTVSPTDGSAYGVTIASNGSSVLYTWEEVSKFESDVLSSLRGVDGQPIGPVGTPVAITSRSERSPVAVSSSSGYLIFWKDNFEAPLVPRVRATRVNAEGAILDGEGFNVGQSTVRSFNLSLPEPEVSATAGPPGTWATSYGNYVGNTPNGSTRVVVSQPK
jgi:hypothetical protein